MERSENEREVRARHLKELQGRSGPLLASGGIPDIVTRTHVWEVKKVTKWRSAVRQALTYSLDLALKAGIILYGHISYPAQYDAIIKFCKAFNVDTILDVTIVANAVIDVTARKVEEVA